MKKLKSFFIYSLLFFFLLLVNLKQKMKSVLIKSISLHIKVALIAKEPMSISTKHILTSISKKLISTNRGECIYSKNVRRNLISDAISEHPFSVWVMIILWGGLKTIKNVLTS